MNIESKYLVGLIFKSRNDFLLSGLFLQIRATDIIVSLHKKVNNKGWSEWKIRAHNPFKREESLPPYEYSFYFIEKEGASFSILLSENKDLVNKLLGEIQKLDATVNPIKINTENVLNRVDSYFFERDGREEKFIINYLYAKVVGMQDKLTSVTLYGKDVLKSTLFLNYKENFNSLTCGLAIEESSFSFSEISRVSNDGYISFHVNENVFDNVQLIIKFLRHSDSLIFYDY